MPLSYLENYLMGERDERILCVPLQSLLGRMKSMLTLTFLPLSLEYWDQRQGYYSYVRANLSRNP